MISRSISLLFPVIFLLFFGLITWGIGKSGVHSQNPKTEITWMKSPSCLKIEKIEVSKEIITNRSTVFFCKIEKSHLLLDPTCSLKQNVTEHLSKISGQIRESKSDSGFITFKGKEGILNYCDYSLSLTDCLFNMESPGGDASHVSSSENTDGHSVSPKGGMKVLTLSLLKNEK